MTSQLNVDAIVDKAGSGGTNVKVGNASTYVSDGGNVTQNTVQGLAKSWCHFDGGSFGIEDSFNVASADDNGSGSYDVNYSNNFASANNCPTGLANNFTLFINSDPTTSAFIMGTRNASNANVDSTTVTTKTHGDLA